MLNTDPIRIGATFLPGVGPYDARSAAVAQFIFILPFFLGRQFLRSSEDNVEILRVMVIAGLAYSLPMLFEVRMSPQLHTWIYGYFPGSVLATDSRRRLSACGLPWERTVSGLLRHDDNRGGSRLVADANPHWPIAARWDYRLFEFHIGAVQDRSALVYGAVLVPLVRWASPRLQLRVASILVIIALAYPILRVADLFPTTSIVEAASAVSADRAGSLKTRFDNEDQLLNHAWQRPWFGWGRFGRNRVYKGWDGSDSSITDGYWIIILGEFGSGRLRGRVRPARASRVPRRDGAQIRANRARESVYLAALALIVAINIVDLLPNSSISPWTWLLVGALLGRAEALYAMAHQGIPVGSFEAPSMAVHGRPAAERLIKRQRVHRQSHQRRED